MTRNLISGILFLSTSVFSQTRNMQIIFPVDYSSNLTEEIAKNKVKSVTKIRQGAANDSDKIVYAEYFSNDGKLLKQRWDANGVSNEFFYEGNCTIRKSYEKKYDSNEQEVTQVLRTYVNSAGKDSLEINFNRFNGELMMESKTVYTYDSNNNLILETVDNFPPVYKNPVDSSDDELIKRVPDALFTAAGHSEINYFYDESGRIIKIVSDEKYEISPFEKMHDVWLTNIEYPDKYTARKFLTGEDRTEIVELLFDDQNRLVRLTNSKNRNVSFSKAYSDTLTSIEYINGNKIFIYYKNNLPQKIKRVEGIKYISEIIFIFKYEFYE